MLEDLISKIKNDGTMPDVSEEMALEIIKRMHTEKKSLQELCNISDDLLEEVYTLAFNYYNHGKYEEAQTLFLFLNGLAPKNYKFVFGMASCYFQLQNYPFALIFFLRALSLDSNNPLALYYASDTLIKLRMVKEALFGLDLTLQSMEGKEEFSSLRERCRLIKERLLTENKL